MQAVTLIAKKRDKQALTKEELRFLVEGCVTGALPDYQTAAFLMAVRLNGMDAEETAAFTELLRDSGGQVDLSFTSLPKVDKHSTGGVGDTTTLILAPLLAACGVAVPKLSGRGLGHTGGTLDKLESLQGVQASVDAGRFAELVKTLGFAVCGQSSTLAPADGKLYALRDVTATVDSVPLMASSIMSKKLAIQADGMVLDIKVGSGALLSDADAMALAQEMVTLGKRFGRHTIAFLTDMSQPLGRFVGNALELYEAIRALRGELDLTEPLWQVTLALGEQMLRIAGLAHAADEARAKLLAALESKRPLLLFAQFLHALGGDPECCTTPDLLLTAKREVPVLAPEGGFVAAMNTASLGRAAMLLGAGRATKEDVIDPAVGFELHVRLGGLVRPGDPLATFYVNSEAHLKEALDLFTSAFTFSQTPVAPPKLIRTMLV